MKIPVVNGLRGVAILGVISHHAFNVTADRVWFFPITSAWLGVNLFLILSGFVLYLPFAKGRPVEIGAFYARRFRRIAPLFYFISIVSITITAAQPSEAIALLSGLFSLSPAHFFPAPNWVLWSLGVEILLSAMLPLIVHLIRKHMAVTVCTILLLSVIARIIGYSIGDRTYLDWISASAIGRLDEFTLGIVAAHLYVSGLRLKSPSTWFAAGLLALILAMVSFLFWHKGYLPKPTAALLISLADAGFFVCLLSVLSSQQTRIKRLLSFEPLQVTGLMCYSLYVWHGIVLLKIFPSVFTTPAATISPLFAYYLALVFSLSALTYRYIEFRSEQDWRKLFLITRR